MVWEQLAHIFITTYLKIELKFIKRNIQVNVIFVSAKNKNKKRKFKVNKKSGKIIIKKDVANKPDIDIDN